MEDVSQVEKFELSEEAYERREDSFRYRRDSTSAKIGTFISRHVV